MRHTLISGSCCSASHLCALAQRNARRAAGVRELDAFFSMTRSASRLVTLFFCGIAASLGLMGAELLPETELSTNCYNFPSDNFHKDNSVKHVYSKSPHLMLALGAPAVDFTLHDIDGNRWNLGEVLEAGKGKPVVLVFGMLTCPAYQGLDSGEDSPNKWTYWHERTLVENYGEKAVFVHVYGPEPHPAAPDLNFDAGTLLSNYWSVWRQSVTYEDRVEKAKTIRSITHPDQVILPDYLVGNPYSSLNQPVWCSYANGARSSILVASNGHVFYQQGWLNTDALGDAIDAYWEQDGQGTWDDGSVIPGPLSGTKKGGKTAKIGTGNRQTP